MNRPDRPLASYQAIIAFPSFSVGVLATSDELTGVHYLRPTAEHMTRTPLILEVVRQMRAYRAHPSARFGLPLRPQGTAFQRRVWEAMHDIPIGQVETYGQVAQRLHSGPRAVGGACGANPYPLVVPCHRVVSANGLGGFGGVGGENTDVEFLLSVKRWLLNHEADAGR